jgi:hypothetical protein
MPIKSFRGKIADGGIDTIPLHTNNGSTGYRIKNFKVVGDSPGIAGATESVFKVYSIPQTAVDGLIDFSDNTLLAIGMWSSSTDSWQSYETIVFDNMTFNQDIYVTYTDEQGNESGNYYLELETVKLALDENTVATLKDIRNIKSNE